jgi:hypothetical protein
VQLHPIIHFIFSGATERFQVIRTVNRRPHFEATFEIHPKTASLSPAHSLPLSKSSPQLTAQSPTKSPLHYPDSDNEGILGMIPHSPN